MGVFDFFTQHNTVVGSGLDFQKAPRFPFKLNKQAQDMVDFFDKEEFVWFEGGDRQGWSEVEGLVEQWIQKATAEGFLKEEPIIQRVGDEFFINGSYKIRPLTSLKLPHTIESDGMGLDRDYLRGLAQEVINQAAEELTKGKYTAVQTEIKILKKGGMLIGVKDSHEVLVYYQFKHELIMDKLKSDEGGKWDIGYASKITSSSYGMAMSGQVTNGYAGGNNNAYGGFGGAGGGGAVQVSGMIASTYIGSTYSRAT